jgi:hypothetical protein
MQITEPYYLQLLHSDNQNYFIHEITSQTLSPAIISFRQPHLLNTCNETHTSPQTSPAIIPFKQPDLIRTCKVTHSSPQIPGIIPFRQLNLNYTCHITGKSSQTPSSAFIPSYSLN